MKKVNLHTHSIYSDGEDTPERVVELAAQAGVELLALTDHNTFEGYPRFEAACREHKIECVKGVEIDCVQPEIGFHQELLAYFPNGGEECLDDVLKHKQQARRDRVARAVERAGQHYNVELKMEELEAMAIAEKGFVGMISNHFFYDYLSTKCDNLPDYTSIQREAVWKTFWLREGSDSEYTLYELIELVDKAGGYTSLAHFGFHFEADVQMMKSKDDEYIKHFCYMRSLGLWGLELHPYRYLPQMNEVNDIITQWAVIAGLNLTVGSDYHGKESSCNKIFEDFDYEFKGFKKSITHKKDVFFFSRIGRHKYSGGKYGIICDGEIILKPTYKEAIGFEDLDEHSGDMSHLAVVCKDKKWGVINSSLEEILPIEFDYIADDFVIDRCISVELGGKRGTFTLTGKPIVPLYDVVEPQIEKHQENEHSESQDSQEEISEYDVLLAKYDEVGGYKGQEIRPIRIGRKWGCIDKNGKEIIPPIYKSVIPTAFDERILVKLKDKYGYFDDKGKQLTPIHYSWASEFVEGRAIVRVDSEAYSWYYGYINLSGKEITPIKYDDAERFCRGRARVKKYFLWGYIDTEGNEVMPPKYDRLTDFMPDTAVYGLYVENEEDCREYLKFGLLSDDGTEITTPKYDEIQYFIENRGISFEQSSSYFIGDEYIIAQLDNKFGLINKKGEELTPIVYDSISSVSRGLLSVAIGKKQGVIDRTGKEIIPIKYSDVDLKCWYCIGLKYRGKWALANYEGKRLTPFVIDEIYENRVRIDGKWYVANEQGEISSVVCGGSIRSGGYSPFHNLWKKIK